MIQDGSYCNCSYGMQLFSGVGEGRVESLFALCHHLPMTGVIQESFKCGLRECCIGCLVIMTGGLGISDLATEG